MSTLAQQETGRGAGAGGPAGCPHLATPMRTTNGIRDQGASLSKPKTAAGAAMCNVYKYPLIHIKVELQLSKSKTNFNLNENTI